MVNPSAWRSLNHVYGGYCFSAHMFVLFILSFKEAAISKWVFYIIYHIISYLGEVFMHDLYKNPIQIFSKFTMYFTEACNPGAILRGIVEFVQVSPSKPS